MDRKEKIHTEDYLTAHVGFLINDVQNNYNYYYDDKNQRLLKIIDTSILRQRLEELATLNENFRTNLERKQYLDFNETLEDLTKRIRIQELILTGDTPDKKLILRSLLNISKYVPSILLWKNGKAITNVDKIKNTATAEQIKKAFIEDDSENYQEILNAFKSTSKKPKSPKKSTSKKTKSPKKSKSKTKSPKKSTSKKTKSAN
jgi:hypothetical protein